MKNSIEYRINNKDFRPVNNPYTIKTRKIDKTEAKYLENKGLRRWASKQNIKHLQEISNLVINHGIDIEELEELNQKEEKFYKNLEKSLSVTDKTLHELERKKDAFDVYKKYAWMIREYKNMIIQKRSKKSIIKSLKSGIKPLIIYEYLKRSMESKLKRI